MRTVRLEPHTQFLFGGELPLTAIVHLLGPTTIPQLWESKLNYQLNPSIKLKDDNVCVLFHRANEQSIYEALVFKPLPSSKNEVCVYLDTSKPELRGNSMWDAELKKVWGQTERLLQIVIWNVKTGRLGEQIGGVSAESLSLPEEVKEGLEEIERRLEEAKEAWRTRPDQQVWSSTWNSRLQFLELFEFGREPNEPKSTEGPGEEAKKALTLTKFKSEDGEERSLKATEPSQSWEDLPQVPCQDVSTTSFGFKKCLEDAWRAENERLPFWEESMALAEIPSIVCPELSVDGSNFNWLKLPKVCFLNQPTNDEKSTAMSLLRGLNRELSLSSLWIKSNLILINGVFVPILIGHKWRMAYLWPTKEGVVIRHSHLGESKKLPTHTSQGTFYLPRSDFDYTLSSAQEVKDVEANLLHAEGTKPAQYLISGLEWSSTSPKLSFPGILRQLMSIFEQEVTLTGGKTIRKIARLLYLSRRRAIFEYFKIALETVGLPTNGHFNDFDSISVDENDKGVTCAVVHHATEHVDFLDNEGKTLSTFAPQIARFPLDLNSVGVRLEDSQDTEASSKTNLQSDETITNLSEDDAIPFNGKDVLQQIREHLPDRVKAIPIFPALLIENASEKDEPDTAHPHSWAKTIAELIGRKIEWRLAVFGDQMGVVYKATCGSVCFVTRTRDGQFKVATATKLTHYASSANTFRYLVVHIFPRDSVPSPDSRVDWVSRYVYTLSERELLRVDHCFASKSEVVLMDQDQLVKLLKREEHESAEPPPTFDDWCRRRRGEFED